MNPICRVIACFGLLAASFSLGETQHLKYRVNKGDAIVTILRSLRICPLARNSKRVLELNPKAYYANGKLYWPKATLILPVAKLPPSKRYTVENGWVKIKYKTKKLCPEELAISPNPQPQKKAYLFYRMKVGQQIGKILKYLGIGPLWGKGGTVLQTYRLNKKVTRDYANLVRAGTAINLPVESLPPSNRYHVTDRGEVILGPGPHSQHFAKTETPPVVEEPEPLPKEISALKKREIPEEGLLRDEDIWFPPEETEQENRELAGVIGEMQEKLIRNPKEKDPLESPWLGWNNFRFNQVSIFKQGGTNLSAQLGWNPKFKLAEGLSIGPAISISPLRNTAGSFFLAGELTAEVSKYFNGQWYVDGILGTQTWFGQNRTYTVVGVNIGITSLSPFFPPFMKFEESFSSFYFGYHILFRTSNAHALKVGLGIRF